ncbi:putative ubiquitin-specific protease [Erysiphe necator]|uniref:Putative ubiquitin-specific protease n=1 Tax=Uncinula necator TaxID=52586 RepID=A0A0B1P6I4_UNCNE|nr:putative ubiquitin-specific protease [Erysiphe necator]
MSPDTSDAKFTAKRVLEELIQERPNKISKLTQYEVTAEIQKAEIAQTPSESGANVTMKSLKFNTSLTDKDVYVRHRRAVPFVSKVHRHRTHSRNIKSSWIGMPSSAQKGIYNPAVLCYRNSLLQALLHAPKVVNWLRSYHRSKICVRGGISCVACHLLAVFNSYWGSTPSELLQATKELDKVFISTGWQDGRTGRQEDPEEQLVWLAKVLSQQLPSIQFDAFEAISRFILNSTTKCSSCGYVSTNKGEVEGTISIDLQPRIKKGTIADYIKPYFCHRVEGFKCDHCSSMSSKQRTREIYHQPETLVIQLKRFGWDGRKDSTPIPFSSNLSLNHYRSDVNKFSCEYDLSAIICHNGGIDSGHYVCRARGPDGHWMKFDDLQVTEMTPEQAMHPGSRNGWTPYLLFYQRKQKSIIRR